jgi:hypothetical protein
VKRVVRAIAAVERYGAATRKALRNFTPAVQSSLSSIFNRTQVDMFMIVKAMNSPGA